MTDPGPTATDCFMCDHPVEAHDLQPDGTRPCRSIGHEKGVPCAECRRLTEDEHVRAIQELRGEGTQAFADAWAAYQVTYDHFRQQVGDGWQAWFTDHHQSALASALIAYQADAQLKLTAVNEALILWRDSPGEVGLAMAIGRVLETPNLPATLAVHAVRKLHRPVYWTGMTICEECSTRRSTGPRTWEYAVVMPHPCRTVQAIQDVLPSPTEEEK